MTFAQFHSFFHDYTIAIPFFALLFAITLKGFIHGLKGRFTVNKMLGSGGMPSAHSTFVIALATALGLKYGAMSDQFMICLVFSIVIIYDAMNVRYQVGIHAKTLNELTPHDGKQLNESIGHTPIEALVGGIIGFLTAVFLLGF
ncbi:divergent PAP2 family protein [Candidatus Gracilibacteria bacterium]|nr:divergent PAP2 family protein [Candidatus Gracilibacteria bacterium]